MTLTDADRSLATPELLDLFEHEKVIEKGLASFIEVGLALVAIKADRKYRHTGFATFDEYCSKRWAIESTHRARLMVAAVTAEEVLKDSPIGELLTPVRESQVRPLTLLKSDDDKREAWAEAVTEADGQQPSAEQVTRAVARRQPPRPQTPDERADEDAYFKAEARRQFNLSTGNTLFALSVFADAPDKLSDFVAKYQGPPSLTLNEIKAVGRAVDQMINEWRYP